MSSMKRREFVQSMMGAIYGGNQLYWFHIPHVLDGLSIHFPKELLGPDPFWKRITQPY